MSRATWDHSCLVRRCVIRLPVPIDCEEHKQQPVIVPCCSISRRVCRVIGAPPEPALWHTVALPFNVQSTLSCVLMLQVKLCSQPRRVQKRGATNAASKHLLLWVHVSGKQASHEARLSLSPSPICHSTSIFRLISSRAALTDVENISVGSLAETPPPPLPSPPRPPLSTSSPPTHTHTHTQFLGLWVFSVTLCRWTYPKTSPEPQHSVQMYYVGKKTTF